MNSNWKKCGRRRLLLGAFIVFGKANSNSVISVRPDETYALPLDGFSLNLVFEDFSKICHKNIMISR